MNYLRVDLKVCEGCGALWLRGAVSEGVYCKGCARHLAQFPPPRQKHAGGRKRRIARTGCAAATYGGAR